MPSAPTRQSLLLACLFAVVGSVPAAGHYRPLATEEVTSLERGGEQMEVGAELIEGRTFSLSGVSGDLMRLGVLGFNFALGEGAEVRITGALREELDIETRNAAAPRAANVPAAQGSVNEVGDFSLATKFTLRDARGGRPAVGFQFGVKLPNGSDESGLANDETDAFGRFLVEKSYGATQVFLNAGFLIQGDPIVLASQKDKVLWGLAFTRPVRNHTLLLMGEFEGTAGSTGPGTDNHRIVRLGVQKARGKWRWDVTGLAGLSDDDLDWGMSLGATRRL